MRRGAGKKFVQGRKREAQSEEEEEEEEEEKGVCDVCVCERERG